MKFFLLISAVLAIVQADVSHLSRSNSLNGYHYPRPAIPFESRPIESGENNRYVYESQKNPLGYPEKIVEPQGYVYKQPQVEFTLPPPRTTVKPNSIYLPPTTPAPKCQPPMIGTYPKCQLPQCPPGYAGIYPNCKKPTTSAPLYIPPKPMGYQYPKPAMQFDLPSPTTTPRPVPSTYLPPTSQAPKCPPPMIGTYPNCQLPPCPPGYSGKYPNCNKPTTSAPLYIPPKPTGYNYPKPPIKFQLPSSTTTPRPVPSTYLPPTTKPPKCSPPTVGVYPNCQLPPCPPGYSGKYPNCNKPTTSAPLYIPPKPTGYQYPKPAMQFDLPSPTTTPRPVSSTYLPPTSEPPKCPPPKIGVYPNCQLPPCPPGYSGQYPNCNKPTTSAPLYIPPKPTGYQYPKPAMKFELPSSTAKTRPVSSTYLPPTFTTPRPVPSTYLPPTSEPPKCPPPKIGVYPNCQLPPCPPGYSGQYPNCNKPTTSAPLYIPPKQTGYQYPKPANKFELPTSTVRPITSTYLPPVQPTSAPLKQQGYEYPKPTTPRPVPSTYLPPTSQPPKCSPPKVGIYPNCQLPPCPPGYSGQYPNCIKPTTSAPKYIPPKQTGYDYPKPAIKFTLAPSPSTRPRPVSTSPAVYLPPMTTTTLAPTYLPPKYETPKGNGYHYPRPAVPFDF